MVSPIEVFPIVRRVGDIQDADQTLRERLATVAAYLGEGVSSVVPSLADASAGAPPPGSLPPCPLLGEDGLCIIYSSRPVACRGCVSADAGACAACDENRLVPRSTAHQLGAAAMMKGVCDALDAMRLFSRLVEIRAALVLALNDDAAERRWLRGEDVFADLV
jgi:hypothetical protein